MGMAGGKVRTRRGGLPMIADGSMAGFNSKGQKGVFPSNYVRRMLVCELSGPDEQPVR